jgi:iron(III) transport system permease protein
MNTSLYQSNIKPSSRLFTSRGAAISIAAIVFFVLCVAPALYMFIISFTGAEGRLGFENYQRLFSEARQRELFVNSVCLGAGSAVMAVLIGAPLGLLFARASFPLKRMLRIALVAPLVVPPYILALSWIYIGGPNGIVAQLFGRGPLSEWTYSLAGAAVVLGVGFYPLAMLATEAAARRVDGRLEEAALLVAPRSRVLRRITLPLVAPSIMASALIAFVLAISEFGVPGLLRVNVYTTEVFTAFSALYDFGAATALAIPLLAAAVIAGTAAQFIIGEKLLVTRRGARAGLRLPSEHKTIAVLITMLAITVFVLLPLVALAHEAGQLQRIAEAAASSRTAINNSLWLAAAGATIATILGAILGYERARARTRLRGLADLAMIVIFAVPSTVVGVGLIGMWNRPGFGIYGSQAMVVIAYLTRFVPVAALILAASVRQAPVSFEEAAELSGAGWLRVFTRIVLPQIKTGITAAWVVAFIFAFGELGATALVAPPGESTLPVRIYTLIANTSSSEVAAMALMQVCVTLAPLALLGHFTGGEKAKEIASDA